MKRATKGRIIKGTAVAIDVAAPLIATICQFPVWIEKSSSATISGIFLLFAFFSCLPFIKQIKMWMKSPSVPVLWVIFFVLFSLLRNIIDQMWMVCLIGAVSNCVGSIVYKVGGIVGGDLSKTNGGTSV